MRPRDAGGVAAVCLTLGSCANVPLDRAAGRVTVEDNVGGASGAQVSSTDGAVLVQVAEYAAQCRLQQFLIAPARAAQAGVGAPGAAPLEARPPDQVRDGKATFEVFRPGDWTVRAQYAHTVLADEGQKAEPDDERRESGEGDLQVGRALGGGYRFDHAEFSSRVDGTGGASARISRYPPPGAQDATMTIHWYYDKYSKVQFRWKIYARGPCDTKP